MIQTSYMTRNPYYRAGRIIAVHGLYLHSVGVGQPDPWVFIRQFDQPNYDRACVHGFIGAEDTIITMPCMETPGMAMRAPHAGKTWSNDRYLGFEMTEPADIKYVGGATFQVLNLTRARNHAWATIRRAVDLFAQLCRFHNLDPLADGVILSHAEGSRRGIASAHADPEHLWKGLGMEYSMDQFRGDVAAAVSNLDTKKEDELDMTIDEMLDKMTDEQAYRLMTKANRHAETLPEPEWSRSEGAWAAAVAKGLTDGSAPERAAKRDEVMAMLDRLGLLD